MRVAKWFLFGLCVLTLSTWQIVSQPPGPPPPGTLFTFSDPRIRESSGLVRSQSNPGCYWTHNDSGDLARLYLVDSQGTTQMIVDLDGVPAIDWEDLTMAYFDGKPHLVVGDIGGNTSARKHLMLHVLPEPKRTSKPEAAEGEEHRILRPVQSIEVEIPGGVTDYEALGAIPDSGQSTSTSLLLVEKGIAGGQVYSVTVDLDPQRRPSRALRLGQVAIAYATGCAVSEDGKHFAVLSYASVSIFERQTQSDGSLEDWSSALGRRPRVVQLPRIHQAEAICFDHEGESVLVTSERFPTPLVRVKLRDRPEPNLK